MWIPFKFLYFYQVQSQLPITSITSPTGCEFLSNFCIFIKYNRNIGCFVSFSMSVVNSFQIFVFLSSTIATLLIKSLWGWLLWIPFKFLYFYQVQSQPKSFFKEFYVGCEFLSNFCIFIKYNRNQLLKRHLAQQVVNSFQIFVFLSSTIATLQ